MVTKTFKSAIARRKAGSEGEVRPNEAYCQEGQLTVPMIWAADSIDTFGSTDPVASSERG